MTRRSVLALLLVSHLIAAAVAVAVTARVGADARGGALAGAAVLAVLVAVALAWLVASRVRAPLRRLAYDVARIGTGLGDQVKTSGPVEIAAVARNVQMLADTLGARAEHASRENALREQILSAMSEGVVLAEADDRIVYANPAATRMLGPTAALPPQVSEEGPADFAVYHPRARDLRATVVRLDGGRRLVVLQDVTEAKRVEAMRRDFVADASHEMKTPVAALLATAETLQLAQEDDPTAARAMTQTLVAEARRLSRLVQDLLDLARLEQERPPERPVRLSAVVAQEAARAGEAARAKGLDLETDVAPDVVVPGSEAELSLAVRNLLDNAVRYTTTGRVTVRLSEKDGMAIVEVVDTGSGVPARDLPRIFERFYRVDRARSRETGGTGLGLAIVRHVVQRHGGEVQAESEFGRGSRFTLSVPARRAPA